MITPVEAIKSEELYNNEEVANSYKTKRGEQSKN